MAGRTVGVKVHFGVPYDVPLQQAEDMVDKIVEAGIKALKMRDWNAGKCFTFVEVVERNNDRIERTWTLGEYLKRLEEDLQANVALDSAGL